MAGDTVKNREWDNYKVNTVKPTFAGDEELMGFHHMMVCNTNVEEAKKLWRDVLGFTLDYEIPMVRKPEDQEMYDDIWHMKGVQSKTLVLHKGHALLEIQIPQNPAVQKTPHEMLQYGYTGIKELGLWVKGIHSWFKTVRAAGYKTQTDYVFKMGSGYSFLMYDCDGNMIQFFQIGNDKSEFPTW